MSKTFAHCLSSAQDSIVGFDTQDDSSLAYVSCLVALETVLPFSNPAEIDFSITIHEGDTIMIDPHGMEMDRDELETVNLIATHYFHSKRCNLPVLVH